MTMKMGSRPEKSVDWELVPLLCYLQPYRLTGEDQDSARCMIQYQHSYKPHRCKCRLVPVI